MEQQKMVSTRHIGHWSSNLWFKKLRWKYEQLHDKRRPIVVQWYIFLLYQNRLLFKCICVFTCCTTIILTSQHHQQGKRHFIFPFRLFCCSWFIFLNPWKHTRTHQIVTTASTATDNKTVLLQSQLSVSHFFSSINNFCWQKNPRRRYPSIPLSQKILQTEHSYSLSFMFPLSPPNLLTPTAPLNHIITPI